MPATAIEAAASPPEHDPAPEQRPAFEVLSHTADIRARLHAADAAGLAQAAADLVRSLLVEQGAVAPARTRVVVIPRWLTVDERFFRFLRELFFLADVEGFLPAGAELDPEGWRVSGERFDPERHQPRYQVKALTRHGYRFRCEEEGPCMVELTLDL